MTALAMLIGLLVEAAAGWPAALYARIGHPVGWIGTLIATLDQRWNLETDDSATRCRAGTAAALLVISTSAGAAALVTLALPSGWIGAVLTGLLAAPFFASRSLHDHVAAVATPLAQGDMAGARRAVSMIVGRDPEALDGAGIARAAIESLAENTSDGITAPLFWGLIFGLPGLVGYKAINTLDSMIGYRTPRHADFGRFAARLDDVANWLPARGTALLIALATGRPGPILAQVAQDAGKHRSPNAGWPETAVATGIGVRLSGPRAYGERVEPFPWLNGTAPDPDSAAITRALQLFRRTIALTAALVALLAVL
ncbi:adenosylcobinamide-phosphate synthase CbiB [Oceanibium sediminis]|uniref:adenosylcobinamide-phosphate synthase CbiB n=1 Tax=Oceanibium sediminis TaxID=2026339 RepID=UPI0018E5A436|nr:adenosylcobinamide-phosphate synthase CbiB [Oceanibium sediminis]